MAAHWFRAFHMCAHVEHRPFRLPTVQKLLISLAAQVCPCGVSSAFPPVCVCGVKVVVEGGEGGQSVAEGREGGFRCSEILFCETAMTDALSFVDKRPMSLAGARFQSVVILSHNFPLISLRKKGRWEKWGLIVAEKGGEDWEVDMCFLFFGSPFFG